MSDKLTIKDLIEGQKEVLEGYQGLQENCPYELIGTLQKVVNVQKRVLHELGYRNPTDKTKKPPPKQMFKRAKVSPVLPIKKESKKPSNSEGNPPEGIFEKKTIAETLGNAPAIANEKPPKEIFKKPPVVVKEEKVNPKRLNPNQIAAIKEAAARGLNVKQISDEIMIVEAKISKHLGGKGKKGVGNLLATNANSSNEEFQDEIEKSKE